MKLTDKNKKIILVGGAGITLAYLLAARSGDGQGGYLGGGGSGAIPPALVSDSFGESAESAADTIINYTLPSPETGFAFESPFGEAPVLEEPEDVVKKVATEPVIKDSETILGWASERAGGEENLPPWEVAGMTTTSKLSEKSNPNERYQKSVATTDIFNWNLQDASNNVGLWLLGSKGNVVNEPNLSKKVESVSEIYSKKSVGLGIRSSEGGKPSDIFKKHAENIRRVNEMVKRSSSSSRRSSSSSSHSRGYSTVRISADNPKGVPGWKQVGAKKPTAPGQPDRY